MAYQRTGPDPFRVNHTERYHDPRYPPFDRSERHNALRAATGIPAGSVIFSERMAWEKHGRTGAALDAYVDAFAMYPDSYIMWSPPPGGKAFIKLIDPDRVGDERTTAYMMNHTDLADHPNASKPVATESGLNGRPPRPGQKGTLLLTFRAARDIARGEELTWAYNDEPIDWSAPVPPPTRTETPTRSELFPGGELVYLTPEHAGPLYASGVADGWPAHRDGFLTLSVAAPPSGASRPTALARTIRVVWVNANNVRMNQETVRALQEAPDYVGIAQVNDDDSLAVLTLRAPFPLAAGGTLPGPRIRLSESSDADDSDFGMMAAFVDLCV